MSSLVIETRKGELRDRVLFLVSLFMNLLLSFIFVHPLWSALLTMPTAFFAFRWFFSYLDHLWPPSTFRVLSQVVLAIAIAVAAWHFYFRGENARQMSRVLEGDLKSPADDTVPPNSPVSLQLGYGGSTVVFTGQRGDDQFMNFLYDADLRVSRGPDGFLISTPIRDSEGKLIARIDDNHWQVFPPYAADKNFTSRAFEVKDDGGHVAFHVLMLSDRLVIEGQWHDQYGAGRQLVKNPKGPGSVLGKWNDRQGQEKNEILISPMFVYPSANHLGEMVSSSR